MESAPPIQRQQNGGEPSGNSNKSDEDGQNRSIGGKGKKMINYNWWIRVAVYIFFMLAGQTAGVLLGRLYFNKGGDSLWLATLVQSAGFPILIPLFIYFSKSRRRSSTNPPSPSVPSGSSGSGSAPSSTSTSPSPPPRLHYLVLIYVALGLLTTGDNLMYSYGLLYIPVSTYSLLCATQLAFNAVFSYLLNAQKFTMLIFNSVVLLTISAALLAFNSDSDGSTVISSKGKYAIGFMCTLGASAVYALYLSLIQLVFEKVIRGRTFNMILDMQFFPSFVATIGSVVGVFASGQWRSLSGEMRSYEAGTASYVLTLVWTAISWQVSIMGMLGLIFEVSSLFCNVISTLALPLVPVFAVVFFHDKVTGIKVIALLLALWGFFSYIYQNYLDDAEDKKGINANAKVINANDQARTIEIC
ncbi:hypothetical protein Dimus_030717 [Dionaea muscipula]